jgi:Ca-activated chloride channel family protein
VKSSIVNCQLSTGLIALLLYLAFVEAALHAQQIPPSPPIRVESALVGVPVSVSDDRGRYVPGLKAADFKLYQDDAPQPIALFAASEEPIRIALLLDTSKSTTTVLSKIKKAAREFLLQMRPQDQAFVVSFDASIEYLSPLSSDHKELEGAIKKAKVGDYTGTRMRDAVLEVMQRKFRSGQGRKAIVLLTDGQDYGSAVSASDLLSAVGASNTVIYAIYYSVDPREVMKKLFGVHSRLPAHKPGSKRGPYAVWDERESKAAAYLEELAELSAGRFNRSDVTDLKQSFAQVAEELRHQYLLGFYPDKSKLDGNVHFLRVDVSLSDALVHARRSYRAAN